MGLLNHRLDPMKESLFQGIARLSLLNDSDRLMERMVCLLPVWQSNADHDPFLSLAQRDQFNTQLHQIRPTCDVVGVGQDDFTGMYISYIKGSIYLLYSSVDSFYSKIIGLSRLFKTSFDPFLF